VGLPACAPCGHRSFICGSATAATLCAHVHTCPGEGLLRMRLRVWRDLCTRIPFAASSAVAARLQAASVFSGHRPPFHQRPFSTWLIRACLRPPRSACSAPRPCHPLRCAHAPGPAPLWPGQDQGQACSCCVSVFMRMCVRLCVRACTAPIIAGEGSAAHLLCVIVNVGLCAWRRAHHTRGAGEGEPLCMLSAWRHAWH